MLINIDKKENYIMNLTKGHTILKISLCGAFVLLLLLSLSSISLAQKPFIEKALMPTSRLSLGTAVVDGKIYAIGGLQTETIPLSVVEVYNPVIDKWDTERTPMLTARGAFGCAVVDGKIYAIGGGISGPNPLSIVEVYDPVTDSWATKASMPTARSAAAACTVNGKIYVIGGTLQNSDTLAGTSIVEEYDPATNTWTTKKDKPTPGWGLRACALDGKIYVTGGNIKWPNISAVLEVYDPVKDEWDTTKTPMSIPKYSHSISALNGNIYSFGGWNNCSTGPFYTKVEVYNPTTDTWTQRTDMPLTLGELSTVALGDKIYIMGGTSTLHPFTGVSNVYEYDPAVSIPEFTQILSGAIYSSTGHHVASGWFDMDNDNDMDVIITNSSGYNYTNHPNLMYKNEGNGNFTQVTNTEYTLQSIATGLPGPFGDIDNDGDQDLINANWTGSIHYIYQNDGYGNFELLKDTQKPSGAVSVLFDLDNDSFLDIIQFHKSESRVYLNDGTGNFENYEILDIPCQQAGALLHSIALGDADNDGDFDLYIGYSILSGSSYIAKNEFFLNNGSGIFERHSEDSIIVEDLAMTPSVNWTDYDNDGDMDLYVLNSFSRSSAYSVSGALFENKGGLVFEKHIIEPAEYRDANRISSVWGDLDNDADLDLYITIEINTFNGHGSPIKHNLLLQNNGDGTFKEIMAGTLAEESSHTATFEDFDNDGDLDVLLVRFSWANNGRNTLCRNMGNDNSWLILTLKGTESNSDAFGARIIAKATINGQYVMQTREITPMSGHATYNSTRVHFGLGDADQVDTLIIRWPSGNVDKYLNVPANEIHQFIEIAETSGTRQVSSNLFRGDLLICPNPFTTLTTLSYELQQPETVQFIIYNQLGEKVEIIRKTQSTGKHKFIWNAEGLPAGVYFCVLKTKSQIQTMKMIKL
jgi:hypothetical protein